jgi:hypothetical protein
LDAFFAIIVPADDRCEGKEDDADPDDVFAELNDSKA